jgi:DNA-directed RNA polymerase specialized sigma24 family protein
MRAPVVLREIEGLSIPAAASMPNLGEPAFESRLHRGRMALRGLLTRIASSDL